MTIDTIIFYNQWHIGDILISQGIVRQFCKSSPEYTYKYALLYGSYILSELPIECIELNKRFIENNERPYFLYDEHTIAINTWLMGIVNYNWQKHKSHECIIYKQYTEMCKNSVYMNITYHTTFNLPNCELNDLLPIIPKTNIDIFLNWKRDKEVIVYYNFNPKSGQSLGNIDHNKIIEGLAKDYPDKYIIVAKRESFLTYENIVDASIFGYRESKSCENLCLLFHIERLCNYGIHYDIGACFLYISANFNPSECKIIHGTATGYFYNNLRMNSTLNDEEYLNKYIQVNTSCQAQYLNLLHCIIR